MQVRELQSYLSKMETTKEWDSEAKSLNHALAIQKGMGKSLRDEWITDSEAFDHMTGNPKMFQEYKLAFGRDHVSIADGSHISVTGKGSIFLLDKYHIRNIYFIYS